MKVQCVGFNGRSQQKKTLISYFAKAALKIKKPKKLKKQGSETW